MTSGARQVAQRGAAVLFDVLIAAAMFLVLAGAGVLLWQASFWPWGVRWLTLAVLGMPLGVGLVLAGWATALTAGWIVWAVRLGPPAPPPPRG